MILKKRKIRLLGILILVFIICSVSFILSDTPDKKYLNPYYVDIIITIAGIFLIADAFVDINNRYFYSVILRAIIGVSIITIHFWQFVFDAMRGLKF